jgi:hypothetical protein
MNSIKDTPRIKVVVGCYHKPIIHRFLPVLNPQAINRRAKDTWALVFPKLLYTAGTIARLVNISIVPVFLR